MNDFVNVLLDTSRISRRQPELISVDMQDLVDKVVDQFAQRAEEQGATLLTVGDFPTIQCDRIRAFQVFSNLVSNALLHCSETENLVIEMGYKNKVFWVRDNGPGIEQEFQDKVFEPFIQGASHSSGNHFGMGLNIVYKIIITHGGHIWVKSKPGEGTRFMFTLSPQS